MRCKAVRFRSLFLNACAERNPKVRITLAPKVSGSGARSWTASEEWRKAYRYADHSTGMKRLWRSFHEEIYRGVVPDGSSRFWSSNERRPYEAIGPERKSAGGLQNQIRHNRRSLRRGGS